jgi:putative membrane protein
VREFDFGRFLLKLLITSAAILVVVKILPWAEVSDPAALIVAALLLGIFNSILRPVLIILTLPINILSFGLFILIINGLILYVISVLVPGFTILNFGAAVLASILISITAGAINWMIKDKKTQ